MMRRLCATLLLLLASCKVDDCDDYPHAHDPLPCESMITRLELGGYADCPGGRLSQQGEYTRCDCPPFDNSEPHP